MTDKNALPTGSLPFKRQAKSTCRILVVEDDPDIRDFNAEVLHSAGYQVDTAEDGLAGWKVLQAARYSPKSYDLLITDHDMPGLTGLALVKKLREVHMVLPIIMASGILPTNDLLSYPWSHPVAMLVKPYSLAQLSRTVERMLWATASPGCEIALPTEWPTPPRGDVLELK
jgi:DNA-binding response OmpR family regulator